MRFSPQTKLTAVIGDPVTHSLSPFIHNAIFEAEGIDAVFLAFGNPSVEKLVAAVRALPIHMTAVTMPHKQTIMPLLDSIDEAARDIGAVNTVINRDGKLHGYNTDLTGIAECLKDVELKGKKVLLIGAGGVAQPAAYHLSRAGARLFCKSRTLEEAKKLCDKFGGTPIEEFPSDIEFDVIMNATPVGMAPKSGDSPIPQEFIRSGSVVFDVVYAPLETRLLREAKARGARTISGLSMFLAQALEQERLWLGRPVQGDYEGMLLAEVKDRQKGL